MVDYFDAHRLPVTTASLDFMTLVDSCDEEREDEGEAHCMGQPRRGARSDRIQRDPEGGRGDGDDTRDHQCDIGETQPGRGGGRRHEVRGVGHDGSSIARERSVIRFRRAKGAKTLEIALHADARAALERYLAGSRVALVGADADRGFLFPAHNGAGAPLGMNALSLMLTRRYHAGGGALGYFGSHRIRHATATILVNNGMPLEEVSRYLGHSSTDVTRRYARHTPETLGARAADALARGGLMAPASPTATAVPSPVLPPRPGQR